jgi:hypothetical protein
MQEAHSGWGRAPEDVAEFICGDDRTAQKCERDLCRFFGMSLRDVIIHVILCRVIGGIAKPGKKGRERGCPATVAQGQNGLSIGQTLSRLSWPGPRT